MMVTVVVMLVIVVVMMVVMEIVTVDDPDGCDTLPLIMVRHWH